MTFDLAVWVDAPPFAGLSADDAYDLLTEQMEIDDETEYEPPVEAIVDFIATLLERWPALGEPGSEASPWALGPEIGDYCGQWAYICMTVDGAGGGVVPTIAALARDRGLICYDPQMEEAI